METDARTAGSLERLVSLLARWRGHMADWETLARLGECAPHQHLRVEAVGHRATVDTYRILIGELEAEIGRASKANARSQVPPI